MGVAANGHKQANTYLKLENLLEFVPDAIVGIEPAGNIALINRQAETLFAAEGEELFGKPIDLLVPNLFKGVLPGPRADFFTDRHGRQVGDALELSAIRGGSEFPAEVRLSKLESEDGNLALAAIRDISGRTDSERELVLREDLNRSRRLKSVGQLAGGIAHDFNNLLGVIMNYAEFVADELDEGSQAHGDVEEIRRAAERAANLTRQLLIFSRREVVKPEVLDLGTLARDLESLLTRAVDERTELEMAFAPGLWPIEADPGQIEQVLVNLAVNARDAMTDGGRLVIAAANIELDEEYHFMHPETEPGRYVRLTVSDTGTGMDTEVLEHAFEPFFTTKDAAEGTGLGLASVHGIVTGAGGRIDLYSELGVGTTVRIHLPVSSTAVPEAGEATQEPAPGKGEIVLVVDDEADVRRMAKRILTKGGYSVIGATDAEGALRACQDPDQPVDLLLTDVIMPGTVGPELVERIREVCPALSIIFMSGYSHQVLAPDAISDPNAVFIEKPFNARNLLGLVRARLDGREGASSTR